MTAPHLHLAGIAKSFTGQTVLDGLDLSVAKGEVIAILGSSGSGKSTLLRCINMLERPDAGTIRIGGMAIDARTASRREILALRRQTAMVFQGYDLFANKTALENIIEGPRIVHKVPLETAMARGRDLLDSMGLANKAHAYPAQLSGGEQQRVGIARALALDPSVILFDEPTSALDPERVGEVLAIIAEVARSGMTMLIVTHEVAFAREVADRVVFLDSGGIIEEGPPESILENPAHPRTRQFLRRILRNGADLPLAATIKGSEASCKR